MPAVDRPPRVLRPLLALVHRPRLSGAALLGAALFALLQARLGGGRALLLAFDLASTGYFASIAWMMAHTAPAVFARRAERDREGRWSVLLLAIVISAVVLLALKTELHAGKGSSRADLLLAIGSIVLSWLFFSVVFAQTYAHADHLERRAGRDGLQFPGTTVPDYWDYLYFAVVLSMTFQTSDVVIAGAPLRRMALLHGVVAFFFNVFIIALTVNVVAGSL